jgi:hypothetical protein
LIIAIFAISPRWYHCHFSLPLLLFDTFLSSLSLHASLTFRHIAIIIIFISFHYDIDISSIIRLLFHFHYIILAITTPLMPWQKHIHTYYYICFYTSPSHHYFIISIISITRLILILTLLIDTDIYIIDFRCHYYFIISIGHMFSWDFHHL